jgi:23S rRNA (guanosine2251-2'-O)-methyltransferase
MPGRRPAQGRSTAGQRGLGGEQVEGRRAVRELLAAGRRRVRDVWLSEGLERSRLVGEIAELAAARGVPLRTVARARLDAEARTDAPQGVLARAEPLPEADLDSLARAAPAGPAPFLVALDGVTDPHNLGALLRTAECAGATGIVLPRHRSVHVTPTVAKAAAGAIEHLPMAVVPGIPAALSELRRAGVWAVGLDVDADQSLFDLAVATEPVVLVLGAEGRGLAPLARQRCDVVASIPQRGAVASLNVSVAGAIGCYEVARRRMA